MIEGTSLQTPSLDRQGRSAQTSAATASAQREKVTQLAREFEAFVVLQMVRQMRESMLSESEDSGFGAATMTDTMDVELTRHLAMAGGFGLADVLSTAIERQHGLQPATLEESQAEVDAVPVSERSTTFDAARQAADGEPIVPMGGSYLSSDPAVPLPVAAPLTSGYGWRNDPFGRGTRFHAGVDIGAAYGREVPSVAGGRVTFAGEQGGYGLTVVVEHSDGLTSRYGHLSSVDVREGETVQAGTTLGRVGSSGRSTGPHLHFELQVGGRTVNPELAASHYASLLKSSGPDADSPNDRTKGVRVVAGVTDEN